MKFKTLRVITLVLLSSAFTAHAGVDSKQERAIAEVIRLGGTVERDAVTV